MLAQNNTPSAPGTSPDTQRAPNTNALNNQYLMPQNIKPAAPGQGQLFDVEPGEENADLTKTEALKHLWHGYQNGQYRGGFVNRGNKETLNQPLPGTAPPPGTRIPGLGDDSQGPPPEQWHWTPQAPKVLPRQHPVRLRFRRHRRCPHLPRSYRRSALRAR